MTDFVDQALSAIYDKIVSELHRVRITANELPLTDCPVIGLRRIDGNWVCIGAYRLQFPDSRKLWCAWVDNDAMYCGSSKESGCDIEPPDGWIPIVIGCAQEMKDD